MSPPGERQAEPAGEVDPGLRDTRHPGDVVVLHARGVPEQPGDRVAGPRRSFVEVDEEPARSAYSSWIRSNSSISSSRASMRRR